MVKATGGTDKASTLESVKRWIDDGFVNDSTAFAMQEIQGRDFLHTGKIPAVGQHVELSLSAKAPVAALSKLRQAGICRLSGKVTQILPKPQGLYPQTRQQDEALPASLLYTDLLWDTYCGKVPKGAKDVRHACGASPTGHRIYMPHKLWDQQPAAIKEQINKLVIDNFGALRGQEIVCEGRLNFDFDARRKNEEGPWGDGIPFDARDIWRFKLIFDDFKMNMWILDVDSFENLGRDVHPRCWPWSSGSQLPFQRCPHDHFDDYTRPNRLCCTMCLGPFGCSSMAPHQHADYYSRPVSTD